MGRPKKHHRVPQSYLNIFCNIEGRIWNYDPSFDAPRLSRPQEVASESQLYSIVADDGSWDTRIEEMLGRLESAGMPVLHKILERFPPSPEERYEFAALLASIHLRSDTMRQVLTDAHARMLVAASDVMLSSDEAWRGFVASHPEMRGADRQAAREFMADPKRYELIVRKDATLMPLTAIEPVAQAIWEMRWTIMLSPENAVFVTSDNPAQLIIDHPSLGGVRGGFRHRYAEFSIPLSPTTLLLTHWDASAPTAYECTPRMVRELNSLRATFAERAIFADRNDPGIWKLAKRRVGKNLRDYRPFVSIVRGA